MASRLSGAAPRARAWRGLLAAARRLQLRRRTPGVARTPGTAATAASTHAGSTGDGRPALAATTAGARARAARGSLGCGSTPLAVDLCWPRWWTSAGGYDDGCASEGRAGALPASYLRPRRWICAGGHVSGPPFPGQIQRQLGAGTPDPCGDAAATVGPRGAGELAGGLWAFFCFFNLLTMAGICTAPASVNRLTEVVGQPPRLRPPLTVTFGPRRLVCPPRLSHFARLG
jgi:hypothetical protein